MSKHNSMRYFLFPHSVVAESEARHLGFLLPNLHIFEILSPLLVPSWGRDHFIAHQGLPNEALKERVRHYLRNYREFIEVHQDGDSLSLLGQERSAAADEPSRILLQSELRGRPQQAVDMQEWLRLESATFLELAYELDERELELENHFRRMEDLEKSVREILGVIDGEEIDEMIETISPPLVTDRSRLTELLNKRSATWYRLFADHLLLADVIPVALDRNVISELTDPVQTDWERDGREFPLTQLPLAAIPNLREVPNDDFVALRAQLLQSGALSCYWQALEAALELTRDQHRYEDINQQIKPLREQIFDFCLQRNIHPRGEVSLIVSHIHGVSLFDLWKRLDKTGFEHLAPMASSPAAAVTYLHLEWSP